MNWVVGIPEGVSLPETMALSAAVNTALLIGVPLVLVVIFLFVLFNLPDRA